MRIVLILITLCIGVASWSQLGSEFRAFRNNVERPTSTVVNPPADLGVLPRSAQGQYFALDTCRNVLRNPLIGLLEASERDQLLSDCTGLADTALEKSPTMAYAHLVRALALIVQEGRLPEAEAAYRQSESLSGDMTGLVISRTRMMLPYLDDISPQTRATLERDITRLARSFRGAQSLAQFYTRTPQAQPLFTQIVSQQTPEQQRRFLTYVRRARQ